MEFLSAADPLVRSLWYIALPSTLIFLIQSIMTFIGTDSGDGLEADFSGDISEAGPFQLFSFRNLINFLLGFSWTGIAYSSVIENPTLLLLASLASGIAFVGIFFFAIGQIQKLAEDNTFRIENCLNKSASVYLAIPGNQSGKGKVMVSVKGAMHELEAVTSGPPISSGEEVIVVKIINESLIKVEKIKS